MIKFRIIILLVVVIVISGCVIQNSALIDISKMESSINDTKQFLAIPELLQFDEVDALFCDGSQSSLDIECKKTIGNIDYILKIQLPSGEKFNMQDKYDKGVEFIIDDLPLTISSINYKPYPNALDSAENIVKLMLEVKNNTTSTYDYLEFLLNKLTINNLNAKNNKLSINIDYYGVSSDNINLSYGEYSCHIKIKLKDIDLDKILVD